MIPCVFVTKYQLSAETCCFILNTPTLKIQTVPYLSRKKGGITSHLTANFMISALKTKDLALDLCLVLLFYLSNWRTSSISVAKISTLRCHHVYIYHSFLYVTEALKFSMGCLLTNMKTQYSNVTGMFGSQECTWPPCNIMKNRGREVARWRAFLGNGIRMRFLVTLFGSHDCHTYHEKWHISSDN
jgi:hypothetical protein